MLARGLRALLGLAAAAAVLAAPAAASAQTPAPPSEAYPPKAIVNMVDAFGCSPSAITGDIGVVLPGSTVNLQLVLLSASGGSLRLQADVISTATATAGADGHAHYSIPVPPNRFGTIEIRATGTNTVNQPFAISTQGIIVDCPAQLPPTGSSGIGGWLRGGTAAVLVGVTLLVAVARRRRHAVVGAE